MGRGSDALTLLFELDADGEPSVQEFKRISAAYAAEIQAIQKLAESAVKQSLVLSRPTARPNDGADASKATLESQREVNKQLEAMWSAREKEQEASLKRQSEAERAFASHDIATAKDFAKEVAQIDKNRESEESASLERLTTAEQKMWAAREKEQSASLKKQAAATKQAEKEGEAALAAEQAAKDKAAKTASDNFLKQQEQIADVVAKSNAQSAANEIRNALVAAKNTADVSGIAAKGIESLGEHLNLLVGHRIPLAGGAFIRLSENVRGFITLSKESEGSVLRLGSLIADLASKTGKSAPEIKSFLESFSKLGSQVEKDEAAVSTFGPALAQKLIPQLAAADSEMSALAASTAETGGAFAGLAGPVGVAVLAVAALVAVATEAIKKMFDLAKETAEFEGKFKDLNQQTGVSVELLSAFDVLASTTGTDLSALSASFGIFQKHLEDARDPMSESAGLLGELGIQTTDTESALRQTFATLAKMPEGFRQTALALQLFGRGGKSVLAIIKETNGDLDKAIERFRALGLIVSKEDAEAADKFNDELELLRRQFDALTRELGRQFLPAALEIVTALGELVKASKGWFDLIGLVGKPIIDTFADDLRGLSLILAVLRSDFETVGKILKDIQDRENIGPIKVPGITPVPLPTGEDSALKKAGDEARAVRAEVSEAVRFAESQIASIDRQLKLREISPAEALEPIIALERAKTEAVIKELEHRREEEAKSFADTQKLRNERDKKVQETDIAIANERAKLEQVEANKRAEFRAKELADEQAHRRALADIFVNALNDRIAQVQRSAQTGTSSELFAQDVMTKLLEAGFAKRKAILEAERNEAGKDPALTQQINSQLADLQRQRTATLAEQSDRRVAIERAENEKALNVQRAQIQSLLRIGSIVDSSRIATIQSLASLRVKSEEQAAKEILKIRLDAVDREKSIALAEREVIEQQIRARLDAFSKQRKALEAEFAKPSGTVADKKQILSQIQANIGAEIDAQKKANKDRETADKELNNQLGVLNAERLQIQAQGNRDVDDGRQRDLQNFQRYADDLKAISREITKDQFDNRQRIIDLLVLNNGARSNILRAQLRLDLDAESERHRIAANAIKQEQSDADKEIKILKTRLSLLKIGTTEEIEEHDKILEALETLNLTKAELNAKSEKEAERNRLEEQRIRDQAKKDLALAGPGGGFVTGLESGQLKELTGGIQSFRDAAIEAFSAVGAAVNGLAQGVGGLVQNWVTLGSVGPQAFRKLVASVLAGVAAQAAVLAIMELAYAIAALTPWGAAIYGPAAAHFKSAALFGLVALGAAGLGRVAAGSSFQDNKGVASAAVTGEAQPNNRNFQTNTPLPVQSSSQAARDGSGGFFGRVEDRIRAVENQFLDAQRQQQLHNGMVAQALTKLSSIDTARPGDIVTIGAPDAQQAIGVAVINHSNASGDFNEQLNRNLGFG